jgi:AcrR family transcriptional regulator
MARSRDPAAHRSILEATFELVSAHGVRRVRIDDIAAAAGVGRQTIYRWWPSKQAVVIDALLDHSTGDTPFPDTGDARCDLRAHMLGVVRIFTSSTGAVLREILAESYTDPDVARGFVDHFWQPRRELSTAFLRRAMDRGQVSSGLDVESALDAVYSPLWCRLLIGHQPLNQEFVDQVLAIVWPGLLAPERT